MRFLLIYLFILLLSNTAYAQWFETQGQAYINNNDNKAARNKAIENALKKTLLIAGASVSSVQQVVNGLLTKDELNIRATGIVNSFEIVNENYTDDIVEVTIRADIFPQEKQCYSADYRKSLLLTRSHLLHREQANIGQIYPIDRQLTSHLAAQLKTDSRYLTPKINIKNSTEFTRLHQSFDEDKIKQLSMSLARKSDSQFILYSEITDVSLEKTLEKNWQFWREKRKNRHFNLNIYIYDGMNGERVFEKSYSSTTTWPFDDRKVVSPDNQTFWQSKYGIKISQLLKDISLDIDETLMCQPTQGKIVAIDNNKLYINLGKRHGVSVGDEFALLANTHFTLANGNVYNGFNVSPYKVKVINSNRDNATLISSNDEQLGNIQINDLVVRY